MAEVDETSKPYDVDYAYAPVGLLVLTFWTSSIVMGLFGFAITILTAKGFGPFVKDEAYGIQDGLVAFAILTVLSIGMGVLGRSLTVKGKSVDGLWKVAYGVIPVLMLVISIIALSVHH